MYHGYQPVMAAIDTRKRRFETDFAGRVEIFPEVGRGCVAVRITKLRVKKPGCKVPRSAVGDGSPGRSGVSAGRVSFSRVTTLVYRICAPDRTGMRLGGHSVSGWVRLIHGIARIASIRSLSLTCCWCRARRLMRSPGRWVVAPKGRAKSVSMKRADAERQAGRCDGSCR